MTSAVPPASTHFAIAPPERQTKSALCAPITCSFLDTSDLSCVVDGHRPDLVVREPGLEMHVSHDRQPVLDGRIEDLPEIRRPDGALDTDCTRRIKDRVPAALSG